MYLLSIEFQGNLRWSTAKSKWSKTTGKSIKCLFLQKSFSRTEKETPIWFVESLSGLRKLETFCIHNLF